jgi:hypothetical protein
MISERQEKGGHAINSIEDVSDDLNNSCRESDLPFVFKGHSYWEI